MPKMKSNQTKLDFTKRATELNTTLQALKNFIYFNGILENTDRFKKIKLLCESDYNIHSPNDDYVLTFDKLKTYFKKLPDKIKELKSLKTDVKKFTDEVQHRAPHILKTGNFTQFVNVIVSSNDVNKVIQDAEYIFQYCLSNPIESKSATGASCSVKSSEIDARIEEISPGEYIAKPWNK